MSAYAMLNGARSLYAIAHQSREHPQLAQPLRFSWKHSPCVATLYHVFRRLDVDAFESTLARWSRECLREGTAPLP